MYISHSYSIDSASPESSVSLSLPPSLPANYLYLCVLYVCAQLL